MAPGDSNNVETSYVWDEGYDVILSCEPDEPTTHRLVARTVQLFTALQPVMQPLAVAAFLNCYTTEPPYIETGNTPEISAAILRESQPPASVKLPAFAAIDREDEAPDLSAQAIGDWLNGLIDQPPPNDTSIVSLQRIEMSSARIRLYNGISGKTWALSWSPNGEAITHFSVEYLDGVPTIAAPPRQNSSVPPALTLDIQNYYGRLEAHLYVHWSWWFEPEHPEFAALQKALQHLVTEGWNHQPMDGAITPDRYGLDNELNR